MSLYVAIALGFLIAAAPAVEARDPLAGLFGNTMIGMSNAGTDRYVFRADNSYLALFAEGAPHARWFRSDATQICFFQQSPLRDDIAGCLPRTREERLGNSWKIDDETMTVVAGVDPAAAAHDFARLAGGPADPLRRLDGRTLVASDGRLAGRWRFAPDHSYAFTAPDGSRASGGWGLTTTQLCLFQIVPRGLGATPVPCLGDFSQLRAGRWVKDGTCYRLE